jgi:enamine deaminase RidA (YjgF/YER057c/UK114 family)
VEVERKLKEMGLELPPLAEPWANYRRWVRVGNLLFVSGHGPVADGRTPAYTGKVGRDLTIEEGQAAAQLVALNILRSIQEALGDLDKVVRFVKLLGMVNSAEGFTDQPAVINGASDLFEALYGEQGRHARSAVGMAQLPAGIPVEIEAIVEVQ